ncbi:hypothetical protein GCM10023238_35390 [Streptomyces heliomycini]
MRGPLVVSGGAAEGGGDVGVTVLAVDADGEVAQAGHDVGQVAGADVRGVLVEGAVADVVELVLDAPGERVPVGSEGQQVRGRLRSRCGSPGRRRQARR